MKCWLEEHKHNLIHTSGKQNYTQTSLSIRASKLALLTCRCKMAHLPTNKLASLVSENGKKQTVIKVVHDTATSKLVSLVAKIGNQQAVFKVVHDTHSNHQGGFT